MHLRAHGTVTMIFGCLQDAASDPVSSTVMIVRFWKDRSVQTVQSQIRLLLLEQSDQGLHCLAYHLYLYGKSPFRMHLRAHGTVTMIFGCLQDAASDPVSSRRTDKMDI